VNVQKLGRVSEAGGTPAVQVALLRDIFGNPFRPTRLCGGRDFPCSFCGGSGESFAVDAVYGDGRPPLNPRPVACMACGGSKRQNHETESPCSLCRSILAYHDGLILKMAQSIYAERRWHDMPLLADGLEEAGCTDAVLLNHCRGLEPCYSHDAAKWCGICGDRGWVPLRGPHCRGCFVIDLLLGKE
jgi:hypothetical protein